MHKLIFILLLSIFSYANSLVLQKGEIIAHTEILGDSKINPKTNLINSKLTINQTIESIKGNINIESISLKSDNKDRDKHMYKVLNIEHYPIINFEITSIEKKDLQYKINGVLTLNGIKKSISSIASISETQNLLNFEGNFSIKLTEFNIEPPTLLFLTVRNNIDLKYNLSYKKEIK